MGKNIKTVLLLGMVFASASGLTQECLAEESTEAAAEQELAVAEHPQLTRDGIRRLALVLGGEEIFCLSNEPEDYKMYFDYWEILNPYDEIATVNTEIMYELLADVASLELTAPADIEEGTDTGIADTGTWMSVEFANAPDTDRADSTATILVGNEDGEGNRYVAVQGYEEQVYKLPTEKLYRIFSLNPFDYILKIPALIDIGTLEEIEVTAKDKTYTLRPDGEDYWFNDQKVEKDKFIPLYQDLMSVYLDSEIEEEKDETEKEEALRIVFHRNMEEAPEVELVYSSYDDTYDSLAVNGVERFLVKAADVEALADEIEAAFQNGK